MGHLPATLKIRDAFTHTILSKVIFQWIRIHMVTIIFYPTNMLRSASASSDSNTATDVHPIKSTFELPDPYFLAGLRHTKFLNIGVIHRQDNRSFDKSILHARGSRDRAYNVHYFSSRSGNTLNMPARRDAYLT